MPMRAPTLCAGGCGALVRSGRCDRCRPALDQAKDAQRGTAHERLYDARWQKARARFLRAHPLCLHCLDQGVTEASTVVDHIIPHRGDRKLFWDKSNWQALCETCHNRKTAGEVNARRAR